MGVARETPEAPAARKRRRAEQLRARGWTVVLSRCGCCQHPDHPGLIASIAAAAQMEGLK